MKIHGNNPPGKVRKALLAFSGWPDAGHFARRLFAELEHCFTYRPLATWNLDEFWHSETVRPQITISHGQVKRIDWPVYRFYLGEGSGLEPVLLGYGPEPDCLWQRFSRILTAQLRRWGCREVILVGSLYDRVFHDEVQVSAVIQDVRGYNLARSWGCRLADYQGPSAIHGAVMDAAPGAGLSCVSVWTHLPFYLKNASELAVHHLLELLGRDFFHQQWNLQPLLERWNERLKEIEKLLEREPALLEQLASLRQPAAAEKDQNVKKAQIIHLDDFAKRRNDP